MKKKICLLFCLFIYFNMYAYKFLNIIATDNHTIFLAEDGKLFSCGINFYGQLGVGFTSAYEGFSEIKCPTHFISIAVGENHNLALDSDGYIWGWGGNDYSQLSRNIKSDCKNIRCIVAPVKLNNEKWKKIYAAGDLSFGIKTDGSLWGWGATDYFEMEQWNKPLNKIKHPENLQWKGIFLYADYFIAVDIQDNLWTWGSINRNESYSFFDYYPQNDSYYELNKFALQDATAIQISKYNLIEINKKINIYGYSVTKPKQILKNFLIDIDETNYLDRRSFYYKRTESNQNILSIYSGYFINQRDLFSVILNFKYNRLQKICYSLIKTEKIIILWTNGKRYIIKNNNIKNIWASNVIFFEDTNNKIYIIGYNQNNRLGINKPDDEFLFMEPLDLNECETGCKAFVDHAKHEE